MKKVFKVIGIFLFMGLTLTSCSSDDGGTPSGEGNLFDKWWYSALNSTADIYFYENGDYKQNYTGSGINITSEGSWEWVNESSKIMRVYDVTNNATDEYYYKFSTIGAHTMAIKISFDGGETWSDMGYEFVDENN